MGKTLMFKFLIGIFIFASTAQVHAKDADSKDSDSPHPLANIPLRNIGPAMISGRISDFAFHPQRKHEFYVTTAAGNLWKTSNNTITWEPIFDHEGSYSIGTMRIDPNDPLVLWVGTGENNAQRSVGYGDGVYKSMDGGKTWSHVGLKDSGHISQIWIDPKNSDTVLVASQGPLWSDGGDRGLYRTQDGGQSWTPILQVDEFTGINEFVVDPDNSNNILASSYQRRRHVWVLINGGPGSGIHRTSDGGKTWTIVKAGLPKDHMGRIGLAVAPSDANTIYAIIEANKKEQGVYVSKNFGQSFSKQSDHMSTSPQYYNELVVDPKNPKRLYSLSTFTKVSEDAGKTWTSLSDRFRHVDDHALWIDPDNTEHLYIGGDGGIYESYDRGQTWRHVRNLPIAQFYRVTPDNAEPFYNVCGGTQDNNSLCAPSRTAVIHGITNSDWNIILGGDGYEPQIDPNDPNTIYAQYQYGGLARFDKRTKERIYLTPHPKSGEKAYKWNWNSPLLLSPHKSTRLYYAAEKIFQSDDRGDSWRAISGDLTRKIDRNQLEVMGRIWGVDTIAKNASTSMYGSLIGITESPLQSGLLMVGSDDGMISISSNGGDDWSSVQNFPKIPDGSYVSDVVFSSHGKDIAYATFDNHKRGDFKPYVLKTIDRGKRWQRIDGNLPSRGSVHTLVEDHIDSNLLFVGTEFGLFFTQNGGEDWTKFAQLPTTAVRDLEIQRRENDLVVGSFGRGVYILDDYSPLRTSTSELDDQAGSLFPVKDSWLYIEGDLYDDREKGSSGSEFFTSPNPPYGVTFSYYLKNEFKSLKKQRRSKEIELEKDGKDTPYPSWDDLRQEDRENPLTLFFVIKDHQGTIIRKIDAINKKGFQRSQWNMRLAPPDRVVLKKPDFTPYWVTDPMGPLALPGNYSVTLMKRQQDELIALDEPRSFALKSLNNSPEITKDADGVLRFHQSLSELQRVIDGVNGKADEIANRIKHLAKALSLTAAAEENHLQELNTIKARLTELTVMLHGDSTVSNRHEPVPWSISQRVGNLFLGLIESQSDIPGLYQESYEIAKSELSGVLDELRSIDSELSAFEDKAEALNAPWTPGRIPIWKQ